MSWAVVFDIDNTLTAPREPIEAEMVERLARLKRPFALAAGSDLPLLRGQFFEPLHAHGYRGEFDAFVCNGASRYRALCGDQLELRSVDEFSLRAHLGAGFDTLQQLLRELSAGSEFALPRDVEVVGEVLIDRGAMINFAPSGRPAGNLDEAARRSRAQFVRYDEETGYRARLLPVLRAALDERLPGNDLLITLGGQTSFDIVVRGRDKSFAVDRLLAEGYERVTYVGDALFPGGNDAAVLEYVERWTPKPCPAEVIQVSSWQDTAQLLDRWHAQGI